LGVVSEAPRSFTTDIYSLFSTQHMDFDNDIERSLDTLRRGGLILYPTDTVWGIGCDATNEDAVQKIYTLKKRSDQKAMIVLVADERDILQYVASPDLAVFDYIKQNPKPVTVIYQGALGLADNLVAAEGSIAIRICNEVFCQHLLRRFKKPIVSTSANISGQPAPGIFMDISNGIKDGVDYIVEYRRDDSTKREPSSVVKWTNGEIEVIRL
jgi:L-threonylcarbamoyladenylate synthase